MITTASLAERVYPGMINVSDESKVTLGKLTVNTQRQEHTWILAPNPPEMLRWPVSKTF